MSDSAPVYPAETERDRDVEAEDIEDAQPSEMSAALALERAAPALLRRALEIEDAGASERLIAKLNAGTAELIVALRDAVAMDRPDRLSAQLARTRGVLEGNGIRGDLVDRQLNALEMALAEHSGAWVEHVRAMLHKARGGGSA